MASTGFSTPRSRRSAVALPKLQLISTDDLETSELQPSFAPGACTAIKRDSEEREGLFTPTVDLEGTCTREGLFTPTVKLLELDIEPIKLGDLSKLKTKSQALGQRTGCKASPSRRERIRNGWPFGYREYSRTLTWPSVQYRLWIDTSNLSFHRLRNDRRVNGDKRHRKGQLGHVNEEDMALIVGSPEKWRVGTSHAQRYSQDSDNLKKKASPGSDKSKNATEFPRLPSRLGRNTFDCFLDNVSSNLQMLPPKVASPGKKTGVADSNKADRNTTTTPFKGAKLEILKLKSFVRNPAEQLEKHWVASAAVSNKHCNGPQGAVRLAKSGKKLSFKIPSGFSEQREADVSLPPTPKHLEDTYHIMAYIATKI